MRDRLRGQNRDRWTNDAAPPCRRTGPRGAPLPVALALPAHSEIIVPPSVQSFPGNRLERSVVRFPGGIAGQRIGFPGLEATITDILVRLDHGDGRTVTMLVQPAQPWVDLAAGQSALGVVATYLHQGVIHILFGIDHLMFVAALLLVRGWRPLVWTITAFTPAHSVTLVLASLGMLRLPVGPVETMIAASILLVAVEAVRRQRQW